MTKCAILCGSAPEDFRQKRLAAKYDSLVDESGDVQYKCMEKG